MTSFLLSGDLAHPDTPLYRTTLNFWNTGIPASKNQMSPCSDKNPEVSLQCKSFMKERDKEIKRGTFYCHQGFFFPNLPGTGSRGPRQG